MDDLIKEGDIILCLDVLIHQPTCEQFLAMITIPIPTTFYPYFD